MLFINIIFIPETDNASSSNTMSVKLVLECIVLVCSLSSFLISSITLILIFVRIRPITSNVPIILTSNTYVTLIGASFMTCLVVTYGMYDNLQPLFPFNDYYCQLRAYINYVFICAFYYSCALQAIFRLFRVVFAKYRVLQSSRAFAIAILIQWIIAIFYMLVHFLRGDFEHHPDIGSCWLSFKNIRTLAISMLFGYGISMIIMGLIYACIIRYIRQTVQTQQVRQNANKRDLLVVKRIIILVLTGMSIGIPTAFLLIIYMITNYLTPLAYHIQALSLTVGLVFESIALGFTTPQVRELFRKNPQVNPAIIRESVRQGVLVGRVTTIN